MTTSRTALAGAGKLAKAVTAALGQAGTKPAGEDTPEANVVEQQAVPEVPPAKVPKARADALRQAYRRAERRVETAKEALDAAKADILNEMGSAEVLQVAETGRPLAEHRSVTSLVFDQTRFRAEHPDQAGEYMKPRVQRRFRMLT